MKLEEHQFPTLEGGGARASWRASRKVEREMRGREGRTNVRLHDSQERLPVMRFGVKGEPV